MAGTRRKQPNGRSSIYLGSDGSWHGRVTVGLRSDGRPDRRHVRSTTRAGVVAKVRALENARSAGTVTAPGGNWTVEAWLTHWLDDLTAPYVKVNTLAGYTVAVHHHLIPAIGRHRLANLRPEHLEHLYRQMLARETRAGTPTRPATVHQVHRTVRAALNEAVRRGYLSSNPAKVAKVPRADEEEVEPFTVEEVRLLFQAASGRRNGTRWVLALALGLRQGEALGLQWPDISFETQTLAIRRARLRPQYRHGCEPFCGRTYAGHCRDRIQTVPDTDTTKSKAGRRYVGLPEALCVLLLAHRTEQEAERDHAGSAWREGEWVFASPIGAPINPHTDWQEWKRLLRDAGVRDGRLHDARHTAATILLLLGVDQRTMMGVMGWSHPSMAQRYAHMVEPVRRELASRLDRLLWDPKDGSTESS